MENLDNNKPLVDMNSTIIHIDDPDPRTDMRRSIHMDQSRLSQAHGGNSNGGLNTDGALGGTLVTQEQQNLPTMYDPNFGPYAMATFIKQMEAMQIQVADTQKELAEMRHKNHALERRIQEMQEDKSLATNQTAATMVAQNSDTEQMVNQCQPSSREAQVHFNQQQPFTSRYDGAAATSSMISPQVSPIPQISEHQQTHSTTPNAGGATNINTSQQWPNEPHQFSANAGQWSPRTHSQEQHRVRPTMPCAGGAGFAYANALAQKPFDLPEFSGHAEQWPVFIAAYRQSTEAFGYSALQNLFRLQKCLKGSARESVRYLLTDPNLIEDLLDDLEFRFGRPEQLINDQMAKLRGFEPIGDRQFERFVDYASLVQNAVAYLNKEGSRHVLSETVLMSELVRKLPSSKQMQWAEHTMTLYRSADAIDFSAWLKNVARCVAMLPISYGQPQSQRNTQQASRPRQDKGHVFQLEHTHQTKCNVCGKTHKTTECSRLKNQTVSERWATARELNLCFGCLRGGHSFSVCSTKRQCPVNGCDKWHHTFLHRDEENHLRNDYPAHTEPHPTDVGQRRNPFERPSTSVANVLNCRQFDNLPVLFKVIPVTLYGNHRCVKTFALLDGGSSLTVIESSLAKELKLHGPATELTMQFIGNNSSAERSQLVDFEISGIKNNTERHEMLQVHTKKELNLPLQTINMSELDSRYRHLRGLPVHEYRNATPRLLIGSDNAHLGVPSAVCLGEHRGPIAYNTKLGWVVFGPQGCERDRVARLLHCHGRNSRLEELEQIVKSHYSVENFGVKVPERIIESNEDTRARQILRDTTVRDGARFMTGLLWRSDDTHFPDSYDMARRRLATVVRKMNANKQYAVRYHEQIDQYVRKGYARKLTTSEAHKRDKRTWYLPHFGVENVHKPDKFRLVFDAAATVSGTSLNSMLLKGPDMNQPMANILFRFRMRQVGVCGDIAEMFHQVLVQPNDRRSQRFLWVGDNPKAPPDEFEMNVMTFGATCSPTSAQYVKNINADV